MERNYILSHSAGHENDHTVEDHKKVIKRWRIINTSLFIVLAITLLMRIWPLVAGFIFSHDENTKNPPHDDTQETPQQDNDDPNQPNNQDKYYLTTQFIGYSMFVDTILLIIAFFALLRLQIKFILAAFLLNLLSLGFSTPMVHPTENALLTILIFSPLVVLQLLSCISLCILMFSIKHLEYHQDHIIMRSRKTTITSTRQSLPGRQSRLPRSFSMPIIGNNDEGDDLQTHRNYQRLF
jgi:hypothetical protein